MATTIKLYKGGTNGVQLVANNLFVIDSIADYLATFSSTYVTTITNFQYIKNELEIGINVELGQAYSQPNERPNFRYVSIQNDGEKIVYYYVKNMIWRSKSCVRFELVMDVLNTYQENTDYKFKATTKITREHKNRFSKSLAQISLTADNVSSTSGTIQDNSIVVLKKYGSDTIKYRGYLSDLNAPDFTFSCENISEAGLNAWIFEIESQTDSFMLVDAEDDTNYVVFNNLIVNDFEQNFWRDIDYINENINPPLQYPRSQGRFINQQFDESGLDNRDWFLLYRNQNEPDDKATSNTLVNPVECYLIPNQDTGVYSNIITNGRLDSTSLSDSYFYYILLDNHPSQYVTLDNGVVISENPSSDTYIVIKKNPDKTMTIQWFEGVTYSYLKGIYNCQYITLSETPFYYKRSATYLQGNAEDIYNALYSETEYSWTDTLIYPVLDNISYLDRTDAKNIKLIKLPYCPYDFTITSSRIDVTDTSTWDYFELTQSGTSLYCLKLNDLNVRLEANFDIEGNNYQPLKRLLISGGLSPSLTDTRKGAFYESKLFHSEFYRPTYCYDSFQFIIQLEKCDMEYYKINTSYVEKLEVQFNVTSTINSKFMFTFKNYKLRNAEENYAIYMPIARNNEEVLYNVPYINYIRTGYNYDIKNKNIANASSWANVGASAVTIGTSLLLPSAPLKVAGVVAGVVSLAVSVKNAVVSMKNNENSLNEKLTQLKNQSISVAGSDDVDLMSVYAENRLKYIVYEPNDNMKTLLYNLFYYAGYNSGRMGIPTHNNRCNFDYLECDAVLENVVGMPQECMNELINCFKNGVTYIHKSQRLTNKWDIAQILENWESILVE